MSPETTKNQAQLDSMVPALRGLSDLEHRHGALEVVFHGANLHGESNRHLSFKGWS